MSGAVHGWAFRVSREMNLSSSERVMLWALTERAWGEDGHCWPSLPCLALDTGLSPRQCHTVVHALEKRKLVRIERQGRSSHYYLLWPGHLEPMQSLQGPGTLPMQSLQGSGGGIVQPLQGSGVRSLQSATLDPCNLTHETPAHTATESLRESPRRESQDSSDLWVPSWERKDSVEPSSTAPAAPVAIADDPEKQLWSEAVPIIERLRKAGDPSARTIIGKLRNTANFHDAAVLDAVRQAERTPPLHLLSWLTRAIQNQIDPLPLNPARVHGAAGAVLKMRRELAEMEARERADARALA
jgi:hypothetical protein